MFYKFSQAKMFTIIDFSKVYYHNQHDEGISLHISFNTQFGTFAFPRMLFWFTVPRDAFQHKLDAVFSNLDFWRGICEDTIILGDQSDGSDHDEHLTEIFQETRNHNLRLNMDKLEYQTRHAIFGGSRSHSDGQKPGNEKVQAINKMPQPTKVKHPTVSWV